jgi:hypothetical protein
MEKRDPWFSNIGNDPSVACGCEKSCDDLGRNLAMQHRVGQMGRPEKMLVKQAGRLLSPISGPSQTTPASRTEQPTEGPSDSAASNASTATS